MAPRMQIQHPTLDTQLTLPLPRTKHVLPIKERNRRLNGEMIGARRQRTRLLRGWGVFGLLLPCFTYSFERLLEMYLLLASDTLCLH